MENSNNNPLSKYFRQPAIYLRLPSDGKYWPAGALDMPINRELPVYPLTTKDEIILRTPDALLNGQGVVDVIQSCVPNILDGWQIPSVDVDAILIAVRIATYGSKMDMETQCPHCDHKNDHELELQSALASIKCPSFDKVAVKDLNIKLKPQAYFTANKENSIEFAEQKMRAALELSDIDPALRASELAKSLERLIDISIETLTDSTDYIELPDGTLVNNKEHIKGFYQNAERAVIGELQGELAKINIEGGIEPAKVSCGDCKKEYTVPVLFDYARFFGVGS